MWSRASDGKGHRARRRAFTAALVASLSLCPVGALSAIAPDAPFQSHAGWVVGPAHVLPVSTLWVDAQGRAVAASAPHACYDLSGPVPVATGEALLPPGEKSVGTALSPRADVAPLIVSRVGAKYAIRAAVCAKAPAEPLLFDDPKVSWPNASQGPWHLRSDGKILMRTPGLPTAVRLLDSKTLTMTQLVNVGDLTLLDPATAWQRHGNTGAQPTAWVVDDTALDPLDRLWLSVVTADGSMRAVLALQPDGALVTLVPPGIANVHPYAEATQAQPYYLDTPPWKLWGAQHFQYFAALDAMIVRQSVGVELAVVPIDAAKRPTGHALPAPRSLDLTEALAATGAWRLVPAANGGAYIELPSGGAAWHLRPLTLHPDDADLDSDGLRAIEEKAAGTSDLHVDSDGDGIADRAELDYWDSDPADAADGPALLAIPQVTYAPTTLPTLWQWGAGELFTPGGAGLGSAVCKLVEQQQQCRMGADGKLLSTSLTMNPKWTPHHTFAFAYAGKDYQTLLRFDANADATEPFAKVTPDHAGAMVYPLDGNLVFTAHNGVIMRHLRAADGQVQSFAVVDSNRTECPAVPTQSACGEPTWRLNAFESAAVIGVAPDRLSLLVSLKTKGGGVIVALDHASVRQVAVAALLPHGRLPSSLSVPLGPGPLLSDYAWNSGPAAGSTQWQTSTLLDAALRPLPLAQERDNWASAHRFAWFRDGLRSIAYVQFTVEPKGGGGCVSDAAGNSTCQWDKGAYTQQPVAATIYLHEEWVPVPHGLEPGGHVLFASVGVAKGQSTAADPGKGWGLFRVSRLGAVDLWLTADELAALASDEVRATFAKAPLRDIRSLDVRSDGLAICLVEPEVGRAWRLTLDAKTREASALEPLAIAGAVACSFDAAGSVGILTKTGALVGADGSTIAHVPAPVRTAELLHVDGRWLVADEASSLRCVGEDGQVVDSGVKVAALSRAPEGVLYLDQAGNAFATRTAELCTTVPPAEALAVSETALGLLSHLYYSTQHLAVSPRDMGFANGYIAWRGDGSVLFGGQNVWRAYSSTSPEYQGFKGDSHLPPLFLRLKPAWTPLDLKRRLAYAEPLRRQPKSAWHDDQRSYRVHPMARRVMAVGAIAAIPTDQPVQDPWEYLGMQAPPPYDPGAATDPATPGTGAGSATGKSSAAEDAGCAAAPRRAGSPGWLWLVVGACGALVARRRWGHRPQTRTGRAQAPCQLPLEAQSALPVETLAMHGKPTPTAP